MFEPSQIQDTNQNVNMFFIIFNTMQYVKSLTMKYSEMLQSQYQND